MADYRLYCLDGTRKIRTAEWIEADSDEEAIMIAQSMRPTTDCELWHRTRRVAALPANTIEAQEP
jgi:hypothetical protein